MCLLRLDMYIKLHHWTKKLAFQSLHTCRLSTLLLTKVDSACKALACRKVLGLIGQACMLWWVLEGMGRVLLE